MSKILDLYSNLVGLVIWKAGTHTPAGFLACDGSAVSRTTYANLFAEIASTWGAGDGSTTFNLPDLRGRGILGSGTGAYAQGVAAASVDTSTDKLAIVANDEIKTGTPLVYTASATVIAGLTASTTYYAIFVDSTHIQLATTAVLAAAGTAIDLTSQGTGTHTFTKTLSARTLGVTGGEETHLLVTSEIPAHSHSISYTALSASGGSSVHSPIGASSYGTTSAGGSGAHNILQPYAVLNAFISY